MFNFFVLIIKHYYIRYDVYIVKYTFAVRLLIKTIYIQVLEVKADVVEGEDTCWFSFDKFLKDKSYTTKKPKNQKSN